MNKENILRSAERIQPELVEVRRTIHQYPETGFDIPKTKALVRGKLEEMGYSPFDMGKAGIVAIAGGRKGGKTLLLRADMDALPLNEEADVEYKSCLPGKMHGCGHDMHTAMLLGAAKLLKEHENELCGTVKLEFQPAEEIFQDSPDMINAGLLESPHVDAALMIHVTAGMPLPSGTFLVSCGGISSTSCEQYHIKIKGKGGHGSTPHEAIDPITAAAHIYIALQEINSRELEGGQFGVFTTCRFEAGKTSNVIPDTADMWGTIRTINPENKVGELIKTRMKQITEGIASAMRCETEIEFYDYCPCMVTDNALSSDILKYMRELYEDSAMDLAVISGGKVGGGSEDFAFVSHLVPTVSMFMSAGSSKDGYIYGQHHPKVRFDDSVLYKGSAAFTYAAMRWLNENSMAD